MSRKQPNPFYHRGPIRDRAYFFDRRQETDQALALLGSAQSVSIVGPRRIGKTSLLFHLAEPALRSLHGLESASSCFVYLDFEGWTALAVSDLYALLLERTGDALAAAGHTELLDGSAQAEAPGSYRALERLVHAAAARGIAVVFLLDEFEALSGNANLDAGFFSGLRGLATSHGVSFVTASTEPLLALTYARSSTLSSPFFNFFAQIRLAPFDDAGAGEMLSSLAARAGGCFDGDTIAFLITLSGPHPLLLQIAGYYAMECDAGDGKPIDDESRRRIRHGFLAEAEAHWTYYWNDLSVRERKLLALLPVAYRSDAEGVRRLQQKCLVLTHQGQPVPLSAGFQEFLGRQAVAGLLQVPPLTLDLAERVALLRSAQLALSPTEFDLLATLMERAGQVISHEQLSAQLWKDDHMQDPDRLKAVIKALRRVLGDDAQLIENVRGIGYRFTQQAA